MAGTLTPLGRKHLDELKYPAPRTVSKLVDQVLVHRTSSFTATYASLQVFVF
jgi:hypothetical protein